MKKSRNIEWRANIGIVGAKLLTSPLIAGCIEMSYAEPVEVRSRKVIQLTYLALYISIRRATVMLVRRGTRCDVIPGVLELKIGI